MTLRIGLLGASRIAPKAVIHPARRRTDVKISAIGDSSTNGHVTSRQSSPRQIRDGSSATQDAKR